MDMKGSKPVAFVLLAFLIGGVASQVPFAFADSSANPLQAIWDAISALSNKQENLQVQIDELRETIKNDHISSTQSEGPQSEPSIKIELESGEQSSSTIIHLIASNAGPDKAIGVKVTFFYEMSLFDIKSISGEQCEDLSRGIVQCFIGTIGSKEEYPITIAADAKALNEKSSLVADISSITKDTDPSNNHADLQFVTGEIARPDVIDSKVVSNDVTGANDTQQVEPVVSGSDSQNSTDAQKETDNSSNSTQSVGQEQNNQPVNGQQSQGPEDQGSEGQNSEETRQNGDTSTRQQNQTQSSNQTSTEQTP